jgi:L,D-transpeptidase catalytic domain.
VNVFQKMGSAVPILLLTLLPVLGQNPAISVEIDLEAQTAYLLQNGRPILATPISSGRDGHLTERGAFKILEKERSHYSSMYGKVLDARGNTIVADADADMRVPPGRNFIPAPMHYFMRFNGADGMHAGYLPRLPCVARLCPHAGAVRGCAFQLGQRWNSSDCVWQDTGWPLFRRIAVHDAETTSRICRPAHRFTV